MRNRLQILVGFLLSWHGLIAGPANSPREETLILADNHRVAISVPAGLVYSSGRDEGGLVMVKLADAKETVTLQVQFQPDPEGKLASDRKSTRLNSSHT